MHLNYKKYLKYFFVSILFFFGVFTSVSYASYTDGTITSGSQYAKLLSDSSRINFLTTNGTAVHITDSGMTGQAWGENIGWISFNPSNGGVTISSSSGALSGYAWGQNAGWINFSPTNGGVSIDTSGNFTGYAWSQNYGWIQFNCSVTNACVNTDWRPAGARPSGGGGHPAPPPPPPPPPPPSNPTPTPTPTPTPVPTPTPTPTPTPVPTPTPSPSPSPTPTSVPSPSIFSGSLSTGVGAIGIGIAHFFSQSFSTAGTQIIDGANQAFAFTQIGLQKTSDFMQTKTGTVVTQTVSTAGAVAGVSVSIATSLFADPLSLSELFLIPIRLWGLLMAAIGIKKRNKPWGTVYDAITKQPLDPAYLVLENMEGQEIATSITDLDGRYGFLVSPGKYKILVSKTNYIFPSAKMSKKMSDELYPDLYFGDTFEVKREGEIIARNIPMDPIKFDWNEFAKSQQSLMKFYNKRDLWLARFSNILFAFGFTVTSVAVLVAPRTYNIITFVIYVILFVLKRTALKPKPNGFILEKITGNPYSFAIIRVFSVVTNQEVIHKIADRMGKYYCLIPNATYYVKIEKKNMDETYTLVYTSAPIEVKNGYLNTRFEI